MFKLWLCASAGVCKSIYAAIRIAGTAGSQGCCTACPRTAAGKRSLSAVEYLSMLRRGIRRKHIVMKGRGIFQHPRMDGMGDQAQGYPNAHQGNYSEQNAYPYPNMPQGGYQQPVYPNKPKKGMKGWAIGLIIGGVILLVAIIAAICVAIFLNFDQNSVVDPSSSIESSTEDEVSFVEEIRSQSSHPHRPA